MKGTHLLIIATLALSGCPAARSFSDEQSAKSPLLANAVSWPAQADVPTREAYGPDFAQTVRRSPVPALVPPRGSLTSHSLVVEPTFFAFTGHLPEGAWMSVHASAVAYRYDELPRQSGTHQVRGVRALAMENEGIWSVSFEENGVGYVVELGCQRFFDPRCVDERYLLALTDGLRFVGGAGAW